MKRLIPYLFLLGLCNGWLHGQVTRPPGVIMVGVAPSGACVAGVPGRMVTSTGAIWTCQSSTWTAIGGGAASGAQVNITGAVTVAGCVVSGAQCVVGTPGPTISFTAIPGTYTSLRATCMWSDSASAANVYIQFNADTAANYVSTSLFTSNGTPSGAVSGTVAQAGIGIVTGTASVPYPGTVSIDILNYSNTTFKKTAAGFGGFGTSTSVGQLNTNLVTWNNTAAITGVLLGTPSGNFIAGSTCSLYGIL